MSQISFSTFSLYKATFQKAIRQVLADMPHRSLDEAAFPAYAHRNPLINLLFWQRLHVVMNFVAQGAPYGRVLDFGCGSGILLPFLAECSQQVLGLDIDLNPFENLKKYVSFSPQIEVRNVLQHPLEENPALSMDLITALDVLEHVADLPATLDQLMSLLKPGGRLIISGPTENILYKIGRKLAGREFTGVYHERGVAEIFLLASQRGRVKLLSVLYPLWPLFKIFVVKKSHDGQ